MFAVALLCACDTAATSPDAVDAERVVDDCARKTAAQCAEVPRCVVLHAHELSTSRACLEPRTAVGCMAAGSSCDDALSYARAPDGGEWVFANTCIVEGWEAFQPAAQDVGAWEACGADIAPSVTDCPALSPEACASASGCRVLHARPYDAEQRCAGELQGVGCMSADTACDLSVTYARDTAGRAFRFGSACVPEAWSTFEPSPDPGNVPACGRTP
jgi:hypothetical protein